MPKFIVLSPEAVHNMPRDFHVIGPVFNARDMSGDIHEVCVRVSWVENFPAPHPRIAIFDSETGEYLTDCG